MRLVDVDELMEHVSRDRLDSREAIAQMIENAPTIGMGWMDLEKDPSFMEEYSKEACLDNKRVSTIIHASKMVG